MKRDDKINIYGAKDSAVLFFLRNKNLKINKFIDGSISSNKKLEFNFSDGCISFDVIPKSQGIEDLKKYYTVVATSPSAYWQIKKDLEQLGLKEFENFEYFLTYKKDKIAIVYGNCNVFSIKDFLISNSNFSSQFGVYPTKTICDIRDEKININDHLHQNILDRCNLFLYQDIRENNKFGKQFASSNFIKKLNCNCKKICVPNLVNMPICFFPQYTIQENKSINGIYSPIIFRDFYLDKYHSSKSIDSLTEIICHNDVIDHQYIVDLFDEFIEKIRKREVTLDVNVSDFIIKNYKTTKLFYDPWHPSEKILLPIASDVLKLIGISNNNFNFEYYPFSGMYIHLDYAEMPIYNSVKRALNIEYDICGLLRKNAWERNRQYCMFGVKTVREYVSDYIMWNFK